MPVSSTRAGQPSAAHRSAIAATVARSVTLRASPSTTTSNSCGRDAQRAARVAREVPPLAGPLAGLEPERVVDPERADAGHVRASVRVDRRQPAGVPVRTSRLRRLGHALIEAGRDPVPVEERRSVQIGEVRRVHGSLRPVSHPPKLIGGRRLASSDGAAGRRVRPRHDAGGLAPGHPRHVGRARRGDRGTSSIPTSSSSRLGPPLEQEMAEWVPADQVDPLSDRYRELYGELGIEGTFALPGAAEALDAVRDAGGQILVVTAKYEPNAWLCLEHTGLVADIVVGLAPRAAEGRDARRAPSRGLRRRHPARHRRRAPRRRHRARRAERAVHRRRAARRGRRRRARVAPRVSRTGSGRHSGRSSNSATDRGAGRSARRRRRRPRAAPTR